MALDFRNIRPYHGTQSGGFEELCCQLAQRHGVGAGEVFERIEGSGGDGGVECLVRSREGDERGWQAKYFLQRIRWEQIDDSVETALSKHPGLKKYTVCLPRNLTEGELRTWHERVEKWTADAADRDMEVEFVRWDETKLIGLLLDHGTPPGFLTFWFDETLLSDDWMLRLFESVRSDVGRRYTPDVHVSLPRLVGCFEGLGRTSEFTNEFRRLFGRVRREWQEVESSLWFGDRWPVGGQHFSEELLPARDSLLQALSAGIESALTAHDSIDTETLRAHVDCLGQAGWKLIQLIEEAIQKSDDVPLRESTGSHGDVPTLHEQLPFLRRKVHEALQVLGDCEEFVAGDAVAAANSSALLLLGEAGTGKTHIMCDIAAHRLGAGRPTILLLGQDFGEGRGLRGQILGRLGLNRLDWDEFLQVLDTAGRSRRSKSAIFIDAINESGPRTWKIQLAGILEDVRKYPHITFAVSCRTSYWQLALPSDPEQLGMTEVVHTGFPDLETVSEALRLFFAVYGLPQPPVPFLNPEFMNPLFLRIYCEAASSQTQNRQLLGISGSSLLFESYIEHIERSIRNRLGYDPEEDLVHSAISKIADYMVASLTESMPVGEAKSVVEAFWPNGNGTPNSLYRSILREGLLEEVNSYKPPEDPETLSEPERYVRFTYQRLADHVIVAELLTRHLDRDTPESSFLPDRPLGGLFATEEFVSMHSGWVEALSIQLPELVQRELLDFVPHAEDWANVKAAFIQSLVWRSRDCFWETTCEIVDRLASTSSLWALYDVSLLVAGDETHPLNSLNLHENLFGLTMPDRDRTWSTYLHVRERYRSSDATLSPLEFVQWIWKSDLTSLSDGSAALLATQLSWFFTSSHRFIRDHATKALTKLLSTWPALIGDLLRQFQDVNDPYVAERLYAAAYGAVLNTSNLEAIRETASVVFELIFAGGSPPPDALLRDYARGIVESGALLELLPDGLDLALVRPPHNRPFTLEAPPEEELHVAPADGDPHQDTERAQARGYSAIYSSVIGGIHDFGRYVANGPLEHFSTTRIGEQDSEEGTEATALGVGHRWIVKRAYDLGWTARRFEAFEERYFDYLGHMEGRKPERIGKKYQWIALHELVGNLSDNYVHLSSPFSGKSIPYRGPWGTTDIRDIDPTLLVIQNEHPERRHVTGETWWAPEVEWAGDQTWEEWANGIERHPGAESLIEVSDQDDKGWLCLSGFYLWEEPLPPELENDDEPTREIWFRLKSYLMADTDIDRFAAWCAGKSTHQHELNLPERHDPFDVFLKERFGLPAYLESVEDTSDQGLTVGTPCRVIPAAEEYSWSSSFDASMASDFDIQIPSKFTSDLLGLSWQPGTSALIDQSSEVVAFDPSVESGGPSVCLVDREKLAGRLQEQGLSLVWVVDSQRWVLGGRIGGRDQHQRPRVRIPGVFWQSGQTIRGEIWPYSEI